MKFWKKVLAMVMTAVCLVSLAGCGESNLTVEQEGNIQEETEQADSKSEKIKMDVLFREW